jgi:hypothetical protein
MVEEPPRTKRGPHVVPLWLPSASPGSSASRILKAEQPLLSDGPPPAIDLHLKDGPFFAALWLPRIGEFDTG